MIFAKRHLLFFLFLLLPFISNAMPADSVLYYANPAKHAFQLSPNGKYIAFIDTSNNQSCIFTDNLQSHEIKQIVTPELPLLYFYWKNNNALLFASDSSGKTLFYAYLIKEGITIPVLHNEPFSIIDELPLNDSNILIHTPQHVSFGNAVLMYNLFNQQTKLFYKNSHGFDSWLTTLDGKLLLASKKASPFTQYYYRSVANTDFAPAFKIYDTVSFIPVCFGPDNQTLWAISNIDYDKQRIIAFNALTGKYTVLKQDSLLDVSEFSYSHKLKHITAFKINRSKKTNEFTDKLREFVWRKVTSYAKTYDVFFMGSDQEENQFLLKSFPSNHRGAYYYYNKKTDQTILYHTLNPALNDNNTSRAKHFLFHLEGVPFVLYHYIPRPPSSDTMLIYLHKTGKRLSYEYNPNVQYQVAKGYQVLMINCPGTTGFGTKYRNMPWSESIQNKLLEYIKTNIAQGINHFLFVDKNLKPLP